MPPLRLRFPLRPAFRFPNGAARRARSLALSGVIALAAQQVAVAVALILSNRPGVPTASINVYTYAQTIYLLPWAVLAVPVATSAFPEISRRCRIWRVGRVPRAVLPGAVRCRDARGDRHRRADRGRAADRVCVRPRRSGRTVRGPAAPGDRRIHRGTHRVQPFALASRGLYALGATRGTRSRRWRAGEPSSSRVSCSRA